MSPKYEINNVKFTTPGTSPMYEMLLFLHHWSEDFKNKAMFDAFMDKAKILLDREYSCLNSAYNAGKAAKDGQVYKDVYKHNYPINSRNMDIKDEPKYNDLHFAKLNPEE
jgi:hypothetical protein